MQGGWLKALLGDPEQATVRAGYALSYNQERIDRFTANAGANPGGTLGVTRNLGTGYPLVLPGESAPVLLSQRSRLGPPDYPEAPVYPIAATTANSVNIFPQDRHLTTPRVHSYSVGVQRSIGTDMALEVRYVGNKNTEHLGGRELERAQRLRRAASSTSSSWRSATSRRTSPPAAAATASPTPGAPGTVAAADPPGLPERQRQTPTNPASYTSTQLHQLGVRQPLQRAAIRRSTGALTAIDTRRVPRQRARRRPAAQPDRHEPDASAAPTWSMDKNWTKYNSLQVDLRRRLSQGLLVGANYTYGIQGVVAADAGSADASRSTVGRHATCRTRSR